VGYDEDGGIVTANRHAVDLHFDSAYLLWTHSFGNGMKLTTRGDYFEVIDHSWVDTDNNNEKGYSTTITCMKPLTDHFDLAFEGLHIASRRPACATQFEDPNQAQTLVQLALKIHLYSLNAVAVNSFPSASPFECLGVTLPTMSTYRSDEWQALMHSAQGGDTQAYLQALRPGSRPI
jgi:hypothetical protein